MNVEVLVCSYGTNEWYERGKAAAASVPQHYRVRRLHLASGTLAESRNLAASVAESDWLCFLDADDRLQDGYLEAIGEAYDALPYPDCDWSLYAPALSINGETPALPNLGRWPQLNECVIGTVVPRSVFYEVGGFREWPSLEDYDLWLRCVGFGLTIRHVPDAVYLAGGSRDGRNNDQSCVYAIREANKEVFL